MATLQVNLKSTPLGTNTVGHSAKLPLAMLASHIRVQFKSWLLLLIQFPVNVPGKAAEDGLANWAPATLVGVLDGVPRSWLWPGSAPASTKICRMKQRMDEDLFVHCVFQINA